MLKQISLLFLLLLPWLSFSQTYKITYKSYSNGKYQEDGDFSIYFKENIVYLSSQNAKVQ
ncbi:MAG: hypothetical protein KBG30_10695 [Bacteroidales bacterium]|jgi:hypothetical protein|nr:hypothetical protein [Bacteroidales bacterium]